MLSFFEFLFSRGAFVASVLVPVLESFGSGTLLWPLLCFGVRHRQNFFFCSCRALPFLNPLESSNILVAMFVQVVSESRFRLTFLALCRLPLLSLSLPPPLLLLLSCYLCCPSTGLWLGHLCCPILFVVTVAFAFVLFMFHVLNIYVVDLSLVSDRLV